MTLYRRRRCSASPPSACSDCSTRRSSCPSCESGCSRRRRSPTSSRRSSAQRGRRSRRCRPHPRPATRRRRAEHAAHLLAALFPAVHPPAREVDRFAFLRRAACARLQRADRRVERSPAYRAGLTGRRRAAARLPLRAPPVATLRRRGLEQSASLPAPRVLRRQVPRRRHLVRARVLHAAPPPEAPDDRRHPRRRGRRQRRPRRQARPAAQRARWQRISRRSSSAAAIGRASTCSTSSVNCRRRSHRRAGVR